MTIKIPKAEAVEKITALLARGLTTRQIGERIGLGKTRVCQIIRDFGLRGQVSTLLDRHLPKIRAE